MRYLLGVDDTDSRFGHCTTHLGYLIVSELVRMGCEVPTYPRLVRLNPNVPFKTRGNAAVCVEFEASSPSLATRAFKAAEGLLESEADVANGANSALIMVSAEGDLGYFRDLYARAVSGVVNYRPVARAIFEMGTRHRLLGNGMGVVGAAASIGFSARKEDHTYELIAYRRPENCGTRRQVDKESVREMELETFPHTFNSFDHESGRALVAPTGPDPVLVGVRGDSPAAVLDAFKRVRLGEQPLGHLVYSTNQCTDAHLRNALSLPLKAYSCGWVEGALVSSRTVQGSHLELELKAGPSLVTCMVYEPSGDLRRIARAIKPGTGLRLSGGVRRGTTKHPAVLNVEKVELVRGAQTFLPSPRGQRHLTKQLVRYGNESNRVHPLRKGWLASHGMQINRSTAQTVPA